MNITKSLLLFIAITTLSLAFCAPIVRGGMGIPTVNRRVNFTANSTLSTANPLKGFATNFAWGEPGNDFPITLELIQIPLRSLMTGPTTFHFATVLEPLLEAASSRSNHAVIRVWMDTPMEPTGIPQFLLDGGLAVDEYTDYGGGMSPDYYDPNLINALLSFISAFGASYDGDTRIGFVQLGLLGFWGEWHTYPHSTWFPSESITDQIISAFNTSFTHTMLQIRIPYTIVTHTNIGYYDDSFAYSTVGPVPWFTIPMLESFGDADHWDKKPFGGELAPGYQTTIFSTSYVPGLYAQEFVPTVQATHASYLVNAVAYSGDGYSLVNGDRTRALAGHMSLGYDFALVRADINVDLKSADVANVTVVFTNVGVAPFYYQLNAVLVSGTQSFSSSDIHSQALPGTEVTVFFPHVPIQVVPNTFKFRLSSPYLFSDRPIILSNNGVNFDGSVRFGFEP